MRFINTLTIIVFIFSFFLGHSQSELIVGLKSELKEKSKSVSNVDFLRDYIKKELKEYTKEKRLNALEEIFALPEVQKDDDSKLYVGIQIAGDYAQLGKSDAAIDMYFRLLPIAEKNNDQVSMAIINTGMGTEYFFLKDYDEALIRFKNAYNINRKFRDSVEVAGSIHNIGTTYSRIGNIDSALYYLNLGLDYFTDLKDTSKIAQTLNNKGSLYHRQLGKTEEALSFFEEALRLHLLTSNRYEAGVSSINLGVIYYEMEDIDKGFYYLKKALENAKLLNNIPLLRLSLENITQMYEEQEQYDSAYFYQKEWIALNDTLNTTKQKSIIAELEQAYQQKQLEQDKEIAELKLEVMNKWIVITVLAIIILLILTFYFIYKKRVKEELESTKSKFYANLAHEFRTPVSLIKSPAQQILRNTKDRDIRERSEMIIKSADQLLELFNQLLDVSKLEAGKISITETHGDVVEFTHSLVEQTRPLAQERNIDLIINSDLSERFLRFDHSIYQKALMNLLTNAIKFSPEKGTVKIDLQESEEGFFRVDVADQGSGIDEKAKKRLFKRFNHSDGPNNPTGIGLGLALSKELMKIMGGDLVLSNTGKEGSVFTIKLKVKNKALIPSKLKKSDEDSISILLVDDHPDLLNHLRKELDSEFICYTASNGVEGLQKAIDLVPDVIISDVVMPEMDGVEMAKKIKENELTDHIPILLLTAKTSKEIKYSGLEAGAISYMTKPFDIEEIKHQLRSFLNWREKLEEKNSKIKQEDATLQKGLLDHSNSFVQKIIAMVLEHLDNDTFTIEELAASLHLSRAQVHRKVKATTGLSTSALVRNIRLEKGYQMLAENDELNVNEVAYSCGFTGPSYFTKSFNEYFGVKPSEIAKK